MQRLRRAKAEPASASASSAHRGTKATSGGWRQGSVCQREIHSTRRRSSVSSTVYTRAEPSGVPRVLGLQRHTRDVLESTSHKPDNTEGINPAGNRQVEFL